MILLPIILKISYPIMKRISLFLAAIILMVTVLTSCNKNSPEAAAEKWLNSFYQMDYTAAKELSTEETKKQIDQKIQIETMMGGGAEEAKKEAKNEKVTIKETTNTSDTSATVTYLLSKDTTNVKTLKMVKRGDKWLAQWSKMDDAGMPGMENGNLPTTPDPMDDTDTTLAPPADNSGMNTDMTVDTIGNMKP